MNTFEFANLRTGDKVRSRGTGVTYVITGDYGERKAGAVTVDITNPIEWDLVNVNVDEEDKKPRSIRVELTFCLEVEPGLYDSEEFPLNTDLINNMLDYEFNLFGDSKLLSHELIDMDIQEVEEE